MPTGLLPISSILAHAAICSLAPIGKAVLTNNWVSAGQICLEALSTANTTFEEVFIASIEAATPSQISDNRPKASYRRVRFEQRRKEASCAGF